MAEILKFTLQRQHHSQRVTLTFPAGEGVGEGMISADFQNARLASLFAQKVANGHEAWLTVRNARGGSEGIKSIPPPEGVAFIPATKQYLNLCASLPGPDVAPADSPPEHPAAFRWDGGGKGWKLPQQIDTLSSAVREAKAKERARLEAIIASDEPDGKWHYSPKRREWAQKVARAKGDLARIDAGEWPLDEPDDTPY